MRWLLLVLLLMAKPDLSFAEVMVSGALARYYGGDDEQLAQVYQQEARLTVGTMRAIYNVDDRLAAHEDVGYHFYQRVLPDGTRIVAEQNGPHSSARIYATSKPSVPQAGKKIVQTPLPCNRFQINELIVPPRWTGAGVPTALPQGDVTALGVGGGFVFVDASYITGVDPENSAFGADFFKVITAASVTDLTSQTDVYSAHFAPIAALPFNPLEGGWYDASISTWWAAVFPTTSTVSVIPISESDTNYVTSDWYWSGLPAKGADPNTQYFQPGNADQIVDAAEDFAFRWAANGARYEVYNWRNGNVALSQPLAANQISTPNAFSFITADPPSAWTSPKDPADFPHDVGGFQDGVPTVVETEYGPGTAGTNHNWTVTSDTSWKAPASGRITLAHDMACDCIVGLIWPDRAYQQVPGGPVDPIFKPAFFVIDPADGGSISILGEINVSPADGSVDLGSQESPDPVPGDNFLPPVMFANEGTAVITFLNEVASSGRSGNVKTFVIDYCSPHDQGSIIESEVDDDTIPGGA
jgi:hypothetical protein